MDKLDLSWVKTQWPELSRLLDEQRTLHGRKHVDRCIARGVAGEPDQFFARRTGLAIGTPFTGDDVAYQWSLASIYEGRTMLMIQPAAGCKDGAP